MKIQGEGVLQYTINVYTQAATGDVKILDNKINSMTGDVIKCLTLKMKVKVTEYNIHNGVIRWQISTSIKVIRRIFAISLTNFRDTNVSNL